MSNHNKHQRPNTNSQPEDVAGNVKDAASNVNTEAISAQGTTKPDAETAPKAARSSKSQAQNAAPTEDATQAAPGNLNLSELLPDLDAESLANIGERVLNYAEEKPLQTIGLATAAGALVGWLLTSKQGHSVLRTTASIATPFVSNLISGRQSGATSDTVGSTLKH